MTHERPEMEVIEFAAAIAARDDHRIVIVLFDAAISECLTILSCSEDTARALVKAVGSALNTDISRE